MEISIQNKFKTDFPKLSELSRRNITKSLVAIQKSLLASACIHKYSRKTSRSLLLGDLDEKVRKYLLSLTKRGGVVITTVENATAKALMSNILVLFVKLTSTLCVAQKAYFPKWILSSRGKHCQRWTFLMGLERR